MAPKKRRFVEIIDLTNDSSDDATSHEKYIHGVQPLDQDASFVIASYGGLQVRGPKSPSRLDWPSFNPATNRSEALLRVQSISQAVRSGILRPVVSSSVKNPYKHFKGIAKRIDRPLALTKSEYDSNSIARDVLLAEARHPRRPGLNIRLESLRSRFKYIDDSSDLSTFRWDIAGDTGRATRSVNMTPISTAGGSAVPAKAVGTPITFDRDAEMAKAPLSMRGSRGRGRGRGHGLATRARGAFRTGLSHSSPAESSFAVVIESSSMHNAGGSEKESDKDSATSARRPGRPRKTVLGEGETTSTATHTSVHSSKRAMDDGPPGDNRRSGRPRKNAGPTESATNLLPPTFVSFFCEWRDCPAELQNLDTLRRHIFTVHNKVDISGGLHCHWRGCGFTEKVRDSVARTTKSTRRSYDFASEDQFKIHMERHVVRVSWHAGDGPKGSSLDGNESDTSSFLMDASGKQVTPSVEGQAVEPRTSRAAKELAVSRRLAEQKWNFHPEMYNPPNELFPSRIPGSTREVVIAEPPAFAVTTRPGEKVRYSPYGPQETGKAPQEQ